MFDASKITSGYDVELNLGTAFFIDLLKLYHEALELPLRWSGNIRGNDISLTIEPDFSLHYFSTPTTDPSGIPDKIKGSSDLKDAIILYFPFKVDFYTSFGDFKVRNLELGLLFRCKERYSSENHVNSIAVVLRFWNFFTSWEHKVPPELLDYKEDLREILWQYFRVEKVTGISGGDIQSMDVKIYDQTKAHTITMGLYFNLKMKAHPDGSPFPPRGNVNDAQCLIYQRNLSFAAATGKGVFEMLPAHFKNDFAEQKGDDYVYPIYQNSNSRSGSIGKLKAIGVWPRSYRHINWQDLSLIGTPYDFPDKNAVYLIVDARVKKHNFNADAQIRISITPKIDSDQHLTFDFDVEDVDLDIDWTDIFKHGYGILIIAIAVGSVLGGGVFGAALTGFLVGAMSGVGLTMGGKEILKDYAQDEARDLLQTGIKPMVSPFSAFPKNVHIFRKRWDPFYASSHRIKCLFDHFEVEHDSMHASGRQGSRSKVDYPYNDVMIVSEERSEDGEIRKLIYRVGNPQEIFDSDRFERPKGFTTNHFSLSVKDAEGRVEDNHLRRFLSVTPTHVCLRNNQIAYFKFDSGLVLSPHEAGVLQQKKILIVRGAIRIYMQRKHRFYYRTKKNNEIYDNLKELPRFEYHG